MNRIQIGKLGVDPVTFEEAIERIDALVKSGRGGAVFTPNVDHVVQVEENELFREAYNQVELSLADGMPILWAAKLLGTPLPAKVSGSDLIEPLMSRAAARKWKVYLLGGAPGVAKQAAAKLRMRGVEIVGVDSPWIKDPTRERLISPVTAAIRDTGAQLVLVAMGAPKQELFIRAARKALPTAVFVGVGASLDFVAGTVERAPKWMSNNGLEWMYRLAKEPRRLWRRYLVRDPKFVMIIARQRSGARAMRALPAGEVAAR